MGFGRDQRQREGGRRRENAMMEEEAEKEEAREGEAPPGRSFQESNGQMRRGCGEEGKNCPCIGNGAAIFIMTTSAIVAAVFIVVLDVVMVIVMDVAGMDAIGRVHRHVVPLLRSSIWYFVIK